MSVYTDSIISNKLNMFLQTKKIPNIIFHGPIGSGKRTLVHNFIKELFNNDLATIEKNVMYTNCANSKGIKFIREDMKFFAKTHIDEKMFTTPCKIIIMSNAELLTNDAQSALRRCIEVFSNTTRFFFITENKSLLMSPILSRFCYIYVPGPNATESIKNYHIKNIQENKNYHFFEKEKLKHQKTLKKKLSMQDKWNVHIAKNVAVDLYENGYSGLDIMQYIENSKLCQDEKYKLLMLYNTIKNNIRNEKCLIFTMLILRFIRSNIDLENILFM